MNKETDETWFKSLVKSWQLTWQNLTVTIPAQGVLAGLSMTGSLPYGGTGAAMMTSHKDGNGASVSSSGYPTPRPGSAASGFNNEVNSFYMGSPQIGGSNASNLFRSFPRPHSSPKMKLRSWLL